MEEVAPLTEAAAAAIRMEAAPRMAAAVAIRMEEAAPLTEAAVAEIRTVEADPARTAAAKEVRSIFQSGGLCSRGRPFTRS